MPGSTNSDGLGGISTPPIYKLFNPKLTGAPGGILRGLINSAVKNGGRLSTLNLCVSTGLL